MSELQNVDLRSLVTEYTFPYTTPSGIELTLKPLTTGQLKRVLAYEDEKKTSVVEQALDNLIKECVVEEEFHVDMLYLQDRFALLTEMRKISKGKNYSFNFNCPKCGVENIAVIDLDGLEVKPFKEGEPNVITVNEKLSFSIGFPTRLTQKLAEQYVDSYPKKLTGKMREAEVALATYAASIDVVMVDGNGIKATMADKMYLIEETPTSIFESVKQWYTDNEFGVVFKSNVSCMQCDFSDDMLIGLADFFA